MVDDGAELLVGVASDPVFGPVVACGAGGTQAELLGDVAVRVCPLTEADAGADDPLAGDLPPLYRLPGRPRRTSRPSKTSCCA